MSDVYSIPSWFPKSLAERVRPSLEYDKQQNTIFPFERLVTSLEMKEVWTKLEQLSKNSGLLDRFLTLAANHTSLIGERTDPIKEPSDKVQHNAYLSLQKDFESIIKTLNDLSRVDEDKLNDGWQVLVNAIDRSTTSTLKSKVFRQKKDTAQLKFDLNRLKDSSSIQDVLETMTFAAIAASHASDSNLPKRRDIDTAKVNSYCLALSDFFKTEFGDYLDGLVATTANVAFAFDNAEITPNKIYKLRISNNLISPS
ncbi:hypothetical protein Meth11DRAFT_0190 [Methylophilaceae bacterium 11]|nr:hypothetical protein Meth11DRAFT_0190 [Methylophilaceae bacterium 11]